MSTERTLMSWVRTGAALIGFGFTIYQFIERLNTTAGVAPAARPNAPRYLALAMIAAGTVALAIAVWQYRWIVRYLWSSEFRPVAGAGDRWHTPVLAVTVLLILVGIFAFGAVLLRVP
jgi:putative membrane protein